MVKLRAFIFGTVMHLYWGYLQWRNYACTNNILKSYEFFKKFHILHFLAHLAYMWKILILHLVHHTHTHLYRYTQTHAYIQTKIQVPFSHFALSGSFSIHSKDIWYTTDLHMHRHSDICTETLTHRYRYTETHACLYTYTNTHTDVHMGNLRKLLLEVSISISRNAKFGYSVFQ